MAVAYFAGGAYYWYAVYIFGKLYKMRRAGIYNGMVCMIINLVNIEHAQANGAIAVYLCFMLAICSNKNVHGFMYAHVMGKFYKAPATIATHTALVAICIVVHHFKIVAIFFAKHHQPIGTNAKVPVTKVFYLLGSKLRCSVVIIIQYNKVIACAMVFIKLNFHNC